MVATAVQMGSIQQIIQCYALISYQWSESLYSVQKILGCWFRWHFWPMLPVYWNIHEKM